jgi:hypothetical protein
MEIACGENASVAVLAAGTPAGKRLEMVMDADGFLTITLDGAACLGCRWPAAGLEQCVRLYLMLLRTQAEPSKDASLETDR